MINQGEHPTAAAATPQSAAPPHPFRAAPWYDPSRVEPHPLPPAKLSYPRIGLVLLGGVVLPVASVVINEALEVVDLGATGVALCLASVAGVLANVLGVRRRRRPRSSEILVEAPRSNLALGLLLLAALFAVAWWGYLALLFLPILPISIIAVVVIGIGLCGLCPFFVTAIATVQAVRAGRILAQRVGRRWVWVAALAVPLALAGSAAAVTVLSATQRRELTQHVGAVVARARFSSARMQAIEALRGREQALLEALSRERDATRREAMAEAYERLTDDPAARALRRRTPRRRRHAYAIRPLFFAQDESPLGFRLVDPFGGFLRL